MKERSASSLSTGSASASAYDNNGDNHEDRISQRSRRYKRLARKRSSMPVATTAEPDSITASTPFLVLLALLAVALAIQFLIVFSWHHKRHDVHVLGTSAGSGNKLSAAQLYHYSKSEKEEPKDPKQAHHDPAHQDERTRKNSFGNGEA